MKNNHFKFALFFTGLAFLIVVPSITLAHSGRTDANGCHTCRTNCEKYGLNYDEYHCHNGDATPVQTPVAASPTHQPVVTTQPIVTPQPIATPTPAPRPTVTPPPRPVTTPTPSPTPIPTLTPLPVSNFKSTPIPQKRSLKRVDFVERFSLPVI